MKKLMSLLFSYNAIIKGLKAIFSPLMLLKRAWNKAVFKVLQKLLFKY